jgi:hypothetical protein
MAQNRQQQHGGLGGAEAARVTQRALELERRRTLRRESRAS